MGKQLYGIYGHELGQNVRKNRTKKNTRKKCGIVSRVGSWDEWAWPYFGINFLSSLHWRQRKAIVRMDETPLLVYLFEDQLHYTELWSKIPRFV